MIVKPDILFTQDFLPLGRCDCHWRDSYSCCVMSGMRQAAEEIICFIVLCKRVSWFPLTVVPSEKPDAFPFDACFSTNAQKQQTG
jgi:hypothetical protein